MIHRRLIAVAAAATLALPAVAGARHKPATTPGPNAPGQAKAHAYGRYCQGESKKHIVGQKGTPFSQCVTAMAKLGSNEANTARGACEGLSKKHAVGQKGTPFSVCISGGKHLLKDGA